MTRAPAYPDDSLWSLRRIRQDPIGFLTDLGTRGDVVPFSLAGRPAFLLNHPDHVERVLVQEHARFAKPRALSRSSALLGTGLLTAEGDLHRERRRVAQPAFSAARFDAYATVIARAAARAANQWRDGETIDIATAMHGLTLEIIGQLLFSADLRPYAPQIGRAMAAAAASLDPLLSLVAPRRRVHAAGAHLRSIVDRLIGARVASGHASDDMLAVLLAADREVTEQTRDDIVTLLVAGHDTIGNALIWTWHALAQHAGVEARLHEELHEVLGERTPGLGDLGRLPYTNAVLAESLRLYPPAWIITRRALAECRIGNTTVPYDAIVVVSQYLLHRDSRFFRDPLVFRPERWLGGTTLEHPKFAYFPFGGGPRSCIGQGLAGIEGPLVLATLAAQWKCRPLGEMDVDARATLRPRGAVPTEITRVDARVIS